MASSVALENLGLDVQLNYKPTNVQVCYSVEPVKADDISLSRELTLDSAELKFQLYLDIVAPNSSTQAVSLQGQPVRTSDGKFSMSSALACVNLGFYPVDTAEKIIRDIEPAERALDAPFMASVDNSHISEVRVDGGRTETETEESKRNIKTIKVSNHSLPYAMALASAFERAGFSNDDQFKLMSKCPTDNGVLMQKSAEMCYTRTLATLERRTK